jgi:CHAP domain
MSHRTLLKKCALVTTIATAITLSGAGSAEAATPGQLDSGAKLGSGATLFSPGGGQALTMQTDGNLVLYAPGHVAVWSTGTAGQNGAILAEQSDGNLVVIAPGNRAVWSSGTSGHAGTVLQVQNDGNAVQYAPGHVAIWSTKVAGGGSGDTSKIAALATANQGRTACGTNSLGGRGYYTSCKPENWCADFAKWVWFNSGYNVANLNAGAISFAKFGRVRGNGERPQVGDAIVYDINAARTSASHVGIVTGIGNGVIHTENGNFGGTGPTTSSVKLADLPATATVGYYSASMRKTVSAIVAPQR